MNFSIYFFFPHRSGFSYFFILFFGVALALFDSLCYEVEDDGTRWFWSWRLVILPSFSDDLATKTEEVSVISG